MRTSVESKVQLLLACPKFGGKATVSPANSHPTPPPHSDHVILLQVSPMPGSYLSTESKTWILPTAKAHKPQDWRTLQSTVAQGTSWEQLQETHGGHTARRMGVSTVAGEGKQVPAPSSSLTLSISSWWYSRSCVACRLKLSSTLV